MATSGTVSTTTFNTLKVIDQAFRRCRLPAQAITAEMHDYAKDALYLMLSEMANYRTPSWCIARAVLPLVTSVSTVPLPQGAVSVLNANYRTTSEIEAAFFSEDLQEYIITLDSAVPYIVRIGFSTVPTTVTFQVSDDNATWTTVGTASDLTTAVQWIDLTTPTVGSFFRIISDDVFEINELSVHNSPTEIPLGSVNRDTFTSFPDKTFTGRPVNYWFQRDIPPKLNIWPSPNSSSSANSQLVVWYHRHIMDVGTLQQELEIPQRWMEAIVAGLAQRLAEQTPQVDLQLIPMLSQRAAVSLNMAWDGDNDGSSTFYQPYIAAYTR